MDEWLIIVNLRCISDFLSQDNLHVEMYGVFAFKIENPIKHLILLGEWLE